MAPAVITVSKVSGVQDYVSGNKKVKVRDVTANTGDYAADGFTLAASDFGLKVIDFVSIGSAATTGTDGATASVLGIEYETRSTIRVHLYESGAQNAPMAEKTAEAYATNFTVRLRVEGY